MVSPGLTVIGPALKVPLVVTSRSAFTRAEDGPNVPFATTVFDVVVPVWSLDVAKLLVVYAFDAKVAGTWTWNVTVELAPPATVPMLQLSGPAGPPEQLLEQLTNVVFAGRVSLMVTPVALPLPLFV